MLNEAIRPTLEIDAFCRAERQRPDISYASRTFVEKQDTQETNVRVEFKELRDELRASLRELKLKIAAFTDSKSNTTKNTIHTEGQQNNGSFPYKCHNCGAKGHRARDCLVKKKAASKQSMSQGQRRTPSQPTEQMEKPLKYESSKAGTSSFTQTQMVIQSGLFVKATVNSIP